jgi:hypothetical protein
MDITDTSPQRMALALERFKAGHPVVYADVGFRLDLKSSPMVLNVSIETVSIHTENVTPDEAKRLIARSKEVGDSLATQEPQFADLWNTARKVYSVIYNYGMGGILMAEEVNGDFRWRN